MKRLIAVAASLLIVGAAAASPASASPVPSFVATPVAALTLAFDGSTSPCQYGPCGYNWRYFSPTTNRLGVQMGSVAKITFAFPAFGWYTVVLKVSDHCYKGSSSWCWNSVSQNVLAPLELPLPPLPLP
jgi:hypothetical protein